MPRRRFRNWRRGDYKPRPTHDDVRNLAGALQADLKSFVKFEGQHRWARISTRKARLVTDLIQGHDIDSAISMLRFSKKRAAVFVKQVLNTAIAAAEEADADVTRLVVVESRADEGPTIKRFQPKDRGRAHQILKRTSHILVAVEEQ
ncbi:MAG: 50S ribosomal protein L22 [Planctomycetes bacterium]|nr:50S ribosomal protein L22 [Planctomycetota bacterium]